MQPYGDARAAGAAGHSDQDWRFIGWTVTAFAMVTATIGLVLVVANLPWWVTPDRGWPLGNPFCHEYICGDYTDSSYLRNVFPPTYTLVSVAFGLSILQLVFLVGSTLFKWNRVGILISGFLGCLYLLAAPIYFYYSFPWGSYGSSTPSNWGGSPGWFMAFVVVAVFAAATTVAFFGARRVMPTERDRASSS